MLLVPLGLLCAAAFAAGAVVAGDSAEQEAVERFASAWADGDYAAMHDELDAESASKYSAEDLEAAYAEAASTATATGFEIEDPSGEEERENGTVVLVPVTVTTGAFGEVAGEVAIPVADGWRQTGGAVRHSAVAEVPAEPGAAGESRRSAVTETTLRFVRNFGRHGARRESMVDRIVRMSESKTRPLAPAPKPSTSTAPSTSPSTRAS